MFTPLGHGARALRSVAMPFTSNRTSATRLCCSHTLRRVIGGTLWSLTACGLSAPAFASGPHSERINPRAHSGLGRSNHPIAHDSLVAASLANILVLGELESMRWSRFSDVSSVVLQLYEPRNFTPLWSANGVVTPSARAMVASLSRVADRGLAPADYDAVRLTGLVNAPLNGADERAAFDLMLTVATIRTLRALTFGVVDPSDAHPTLRISRDSVDFTPAIAALVSGIATDSILDSAEPRLVTYQTLKSNLALYRARAAIDSSQQHRVAQIVVTLERWRWLPRSFATPPVIVNIPAFDMDAWSSDGSPGMSALHMKVVAGTAGVHETPIMADTIRFIEFAPYWILPLSIVKGELMPMAMRDPHILTVNNYEVLNRRGRVLVSSLASLRMVLAGTAFIRQLPGGLNSLGKVKFLFPNVHDVYLHDSPVRADFRRSRRDQSHGCVRLGDARAFAAFLLRDQPEWTASRIDAAMSDRMPTRIGLVRPVPIFLFYATADARPDGGIVFHDDIYGHDATLAALMSGRYGPRGVVGDDAAALAGRQ